MKLEVGAREAYAYTAGRALDAALPSILFIHGGDQDHSVWSLQSRYFAHHGFNVLVPDLPGHGRSAGPPLASIELFADWVASLCDAAHVQHARIVGHSMGSLIALELAARHPARADKLALLGTAAPMQVAAPLLESARANEHAALDMVNVWSHGGRAQIGGNTAPGMWMLGMNIRLMERQQRDVLYSDFAACNAYAHGVAAASGVACPVLVVTAERDRMTPPHAAQSLIHAFAHARTIALAGAGHALMAEQPDAVLDALIGFL
jgi:pimeloyl-ACP methyl ester carboxylesterase